MYPIPPSETLVETKTCRHCSVPFPITDKDLEFYEKVSPLLNGKKYSIPSPTLCPDCRQQRRLSFRNERKLYKRKCDATGRDIISIYSPDKPFKVYHQDFWWSDKWDPMEYGREFDFGRSFFEQFVEMMGEVPVAGNTSVGSENSDYAQMTKSKNCYYSFVWWFNEDILYSVWIVYSKDCVDCYRCGKLENSYNCTHCYESYRLNSCIQCIWSSESAFCWNLTSCNNCFLSGHITNQKYLFKNQQLDAEEYLLRVEEYLKSHTHAEIMKERDLLVKKSTNPQNRNADIENCSWDYILHSKECHFCFDISTAENCKYYFDSGGNIRNCMDNSYWFDGSWCYENVIASGNKNLFNLMSYPDWNETLYSFYCSFSSHLFWCIGLRNKSYCILNKQYTREEYEALVPKIIEHMMKPLPRPSGTPSNEGECEWGEFFPSTLSPFGYNETVAMEYYPLTREEVLKIPLEKGGGDGGAGGLVAEVKYWETRGLIWSNPPTPFLKGEIFNWSDYEAPFPKVEKIIPADKLPDDISKIPDDILNWAIECEVTKKPFRIIKQELDFYRKHNLPIPRRHPDQRHLDRMALRNPRKLFERKCDKCGVEMVTTYSPDRPERVYCEECYNREIVL